MVNSIDEPSELVTTRNEYVGAHWEIVNNPVSRICKLVDVIFHSIAKLILFDQAPREGTHHYFFS